MLLEKEEEPNKVVVVIDGGEFRPIEWEESNDLKKKKKVLSNPTSCTILAVVISFVVNSYTREIQTTIHKGIGWVWDNVQRCRRISI